MPFADIFSGFNQRRQAYADENYKREKETSDREYNLLATLAQHPDPEIASLGATGLLQLASGVKPGKGLRGFLGEVDRSTFLPQIKALMATPPPQEGSAALPSSSPIEPSRQASGPPMMSAPPTGTGPPQMSTAGELGGGDPFAEMGGGPPPMPGMGAAAAAAPAPLTVPEHPQQRFRRLFPTAGEIAAETQFQTLRGKLRAIAQYLSPSEMTDAALGMAGAPRRQTQGRVLNAEFRTADGQELSGAVVFDPYSKEATVDGEPVTILRQLPTNPPRPIRQRMATGAPGSQTYTDLWLDPSDMTKPPLMEADTGIPVTPPPGPFTGGPTEVTDASGKPTLVRPTRTGVQPVEGYGPKPTAPTGTGREQADATGLLETVKREIAAREASARAYPGAPAVRLSVKQIDQIVKDLSKGRFQDYAGLTAATKQTRPDAPGSNRDRANKVRERLDQQRGDTISGSGMPKY